MSLIYDIERKTEERKNKPHTESCWIIGLFLTVYIVTLCGLLIRNRTYGEETWSAEYSLEPVAIDDRESLPAAWLHGLVDPVQAQRAAVDLKQVLWLSSLVGFGSATDVDPNWKACCYHSRVAVARTGNHGSGAGCKEKGEKITLSHRSTQSVLK